MGQPNNRAALESTELAHRLVGTWGGITLPDTWKVMVSYLSGVADAMVYIAPECGADLLSELNLLIEVAEERASMARRDHDAILSVFLKHTQTHSQYTQWCDRISRSNHHA